MNKPLNDPIIGHPAMKGRRWTIDYDNISKYKSYYEDLIPGGAGDNTTAQQVDQNELQMGIKVEMEHTNDINRAREIALDHLTENPRYYSILKTSTLAPEL